MNIKTSLGHNGITIANFRGQSEHTANYPFIILRGYLAQPAGSHIKKVVVVNETNAFRSTWSVCRRHFRGVVSLNLGSNVVRVTASLFGDGSNLETTLGISYQPAQSDYFVMPLYVICRDSNGHFQAEKDENASLGSALQRIATGAGLLQSFTAEKLVEEGFPRKTFRLDSDGTGMPKCSVFRTKLKQEELYTLQDVDLWRYIKKELATELPDLKGKCKFLAFLADTRYKLLKEGDGAPKLYEDVLRNVRGHVALGGSSLALLGTGCLYTWPENLVDLPRYLTDERPINKECFMDDSAYRGTRWACFSTTLGAACHELGHAFDLGHTPTGIMARGFDNIYKEFTAERPAPVASIMHEYPFITSLPFAVVTPKGILIPTKLISKSSATTESDMETVSTNPSFSPEIEGHGAKLHKSSSEKNLFARVSGSFRTKLFATKTKDSKPDEMPTPSRKYSLESPIDDAFSTSSCAISLCDPEGMHSRSPSTRPSSTLSAAKKSRNWHKRLSGSFAGLKSPTESCTELVDKIVHPSTTPTINYITPLNSVVTKDYSKHVTYHSEKGDQQVIHADIHKSATLPARILNGDPMGHKHKSAWKRLFSRKKKDPLKECEESDVKDSMGKSPESKMDYIVESRTGAETVIYTSGPLLEPAEPSHSDGLNSVDGLIFESEDESSYRAKSPESLEEFSFKFEKEEGHHIDATLPQHIVYEIHQLEPAQHVAVGVVSQKKVVEQEKERDVTSETIEVKTVPVPTIRARSAVGKERKGLPVQTNGTTEAEGQTLDTEKKAPKKDAGPVQKRAFGRSASADILDGRATAVKKVQRTEPETKKAQLAEPLARKVMPDESGTKKLVHTDAERPKPVRKTKSTEPHEKLEPLESKKKEETNIAAKLKPATSVIIRAREADRATEVESGTLKASKLKYPLRTAAAGGRPSNSTSLRPKVQNRIPLQSTQSSRNKENIPARSKTAEKTAEEKKVIIKRRSFRRRNSGRGQKASSRKTTQASQHDPKPPSSRLDFTQITFSQSTNRARSSSTSRDTISNLGSFINGSATDADNKDFDEWESLEGTSSPVSMPSSCSGDTEHSGCGQRGGVKGKQNASSLINTPSGISVMEDLDVPHRLPLPQPPPSESAVVLVGGDANPSWTRNCATLLNYHKWFNTSCVSAPTVDVGKSLDASLQMPELIGDTLTAPAGLRLVELRDKCGNVLHYWEFVSDKEAPTTFHIALPFKSSQTAGRDNSVSQQTEMTVIALDTFGNIINRSMPVNSC